jgi:hypothetical protein
MQIVIEIPEDIGRALSIGSILPYAQRSKVSPQRDIVVACFPNTSL